MSVHVEIQASGPGASDLKRAMVGLFIGMKANRRISVEKFNINHAPPSYRDQSQLAAALIGHFGISYLDIIEKSGTPRPRRAATFGQDGRMRRRPRKK